MAVLAPPDWPTRDLTGLTMDTPASTTNPTAPRQRSPSSNEQQNSAQQQQQQQAPYSYPVQQQQPQGAWTPSISAQPFYPTFYQNHHQQQQQQQPSFTPHPQYSHSPQGSIPQQPPYFDPANAQLAQAQVQWAYQQMMFNGFPHIPQHHGQRSNPPSPAEYFAASQIPSPFNPFPTSTPPPIPNNTSFTGRGNDPNSQTQYNGFHPYRRPNRQNSHSPETTDWRSGGPQPPYAQRDASGSSSSVNSMNNNNGVVPRPRTNSTQSAHSSGHGHGSTVRRTPPPTETARARTGSNSSASSSNTAVGSASLGPSKATRVPHHRNASSSSSSHSHSHGQSHTSQKPAALHTKSSSNTGNVVPASSAQRPARPSPLSQGNFTAAEKRMSRDDSELGLTLSNAMRSDKDPTPSASMVRSGGLKGRLRRALSFNAEKALKEEAEREEEDDDDVSIKASAGASASTSASTSKVKAAPTPAVPPKAGPTKSASTPNVVLNSPDIDGASTATVQTKKKSRAASLFNSRLNASTDNISLSSTVSSASVMIRKLGSMGKLARRNSLAGITSLFKEKKEKEKPGEDGKGKSKAKKGKAEASEASVSHVTAELDRTTSGDWTAGPEMSGLSPAAKLARQHTLKSNAEAAARAKAAHEAVVTAEKYKSSAPGSPSTGSGSGSSAPTPATWERNTGTRAAGRTRVSEDGTRVVVEDEDDGSEDDSDDGSLERPPPHEARWDDDDWDGDGDEDVTIRIGLQRASIGDGEEVEEADEPWAIGVRRSVEKARKPAKGILKRAGTYDQQAYAVDRPVSNTRARSNSYNSHPGQTGELGPLARIPSPDPDHIDGLHRHPSHTAPTLPPLSFETSSPSAPLQRSSSQRGQPASSREMTASEYSPLAPHPPEKTSGLFSHPNSSAPALSTMFSNNKPPVLAHRSATSPGKRLAFANNLSVYDTFSASMYDRRSEPATWSRLTPALAQRIKEELNSYKMEEMEVHAASRIHTQFFV